MPPHDAAPSPSPPAAAPTPARGLHPGLPPAGALDPARLQALTLDLDDTLWPIVPTLLRAEDALAAWLRRHAPATAAAWPAPAMVRLRAEIGRAHPGLAHDLTALRLKTLDHALRAAGDDPALAVPAFEVFFDARQRIELHPEVPAALDRLAARWPLLALSNGNADLARTGIARWFCGSVSAREAGVAKPDARIFAAACARLGVPPAAVLHVGDDAHTDIDGARAAGLRAAWVRRPGTAAHAGPAPRHAPCWQGSDLAALADALGV